MTDRTKRRIAAKPEPAEPIEMRLARVESKLDQLTDYVHTELGQEGELGESLLVMFGYFLAAMADLRDAGLLAQGNLHAGSVRDALQSFIDIVEAVCDMPDAVTHLKNTFPEHASTLDLMLTENQNAGS